MHISAVTVTVNDLDQAAEFYGEVLQLPTRLHPDGRSLLVSVGRSVMRLQYEPTARVCDHLAFGIPADAFPRAKQWLHDRVDLYEQDGDNEFEGPPGWESRSLYFAGPSGAVLELIARRRLSDKAVGPAFTSGDILCVSEVAIAVPDVLDAVRSLTAQSDVVPFAAAPTEEFAAVGDDHGLLIIAVEGRPWRPTRDRLAVASPLSVTVDELSGRRIVIGRARIH